MKSRDYNKLLLAEQHFCSKDHDFKKYPKFTIIELIEKKALENMKMKETDENELI